MFKGLDLLVPLKGDVSTSQLYVLALWQRFGEGSFLSQHDCAPVHHKGIKTVYLKGSDGVLSSRLCYARVATMAGQNILDILKN